MMKKRSILTAPRKDLISFIQKGVFALLIIVCVSAVFLYKFADIDAAEKAQKQSLITALKVHTQSVEEGWYQWLLRSDSGKASINDESVLPKADVIYKRLQEDYAQIDQQLSQISSNPVKGQVLSVKPEIAFLASLPANKIDSFQLSAQDRMQVYHFIANADEQSQKLTELELTLNYHNKTILNPAIWRIFTVLGLIALVLLIWSVYLVKHVTKGIHHVHLVLERHKQGSFTHDLHYHFEDEFTDIGRQLDNELSTREFEVFEVRTEHSLLEQSLLRLESAFLVANEYGDVKWLSKGFHDLWNANMDDFEHVFSIDPGIDGPLGEQLPHSILSGDQEVKLTLSGSRYAVVVEALKDEVGDELGYLLVLSPLSQLAEIEVLRRSLELMVKGSWQYPIRVLRDDSPYKDFSVLLEEIRAVAQSLIDEANRDRKGDQKVTKLQQIKSFLNPKIDDNYDSNGEILNVPVIRLPESAAQQLSDVSSLSEQVVDTVLVGYELLLQRLVLVEKDVTNHVLLLKDVERCLNEVRAGVLSSLSMAEGEGDAIRHRYAVDLDHDIDSVQSQIAAVQETVSLTLSLLETDHSVGEARLDKAKRSLTELSERITALLEQHQSPELEENDLISLPSNSSELDEF